MKRVVGVLFAVATLSIVALAADPKSQPVKGESAPAEKKCEYKSCAMPSLQGGGLKDSSQVGGEGEKTRGMFSSVCQTPTFWCVIGPGPVGVPCYCNTTMGPVFGVTVQ